MSSDYRPRGSSGGRRRRGGRNRPGHSSPRYNNQTKNGSSSSSSTPSTGFFARIFGWIFGNKKTASTAEARKPGTNTPTTAPVRDKETRPKREERPKSEPVLHEITSAKLYVGNLAYEAAESDLFDLFSKVGHVKNVEIAMDRHSNRSKGFGFVEMESLETAKEAAAKYNRTEFMGREILVSGAKTDKRLSEVRNSSPITEESAI